jgi:hypothetical protein
LLNCFINSRAPTATRRFDGCYSNREQLVRFAQQIREPALLQKLECGNHLYPLRRFIALFLDDAEFCYEIRA